MGKHKIILRREKHLIYIYNTELKKTLRYDLVGKVMEKQNKEGIWEQVLRQYPFFYGYGTNDVYCKEPKFKQMIEKTKYLNPQCSSLSTFIARMKDALVYENYIEEGIKAECCVYRYGYRCGDKKVLTKPLEFYSRNMIKFFKDFKIEVTCRLEYNFNSNYSFLEKFICILLCNQDFSNEEKKELFSSIVERSDYVAEFKELVETYNYDIVALCKFLIHYLKHFENISITEGINLLKDYYSMATKIERNVKKYPKYLKSMHDIITVNYNAFKRKYNEELFLNLRKKELDFEEDKVYVVITPQSTKEIVKEGTNLCHCVGSYIDNILDNKTYIFFLRKKEAPEQSLVTLEYKNEKIVTAKGSCNREINKEEKEFLEVYCKKKSIQMEV